MYNFIILCVCSYDNIIASKQKDLITKCGIIYRKILILDTNVFL